MIRERGIREVSTIDIRMSKNYRFILLLLFILLLTCVISLVMRTGTIYKLQCQITGKFYIGSTTRGIEKAVRELNNNFKCYKRGKYKSSDSVFEVFAHNNYNVTILEIIHELANNTNFSLKLRKLQRIYIDEYDNVVNKYIPSRTKKEYRADHRDHYIQRSKKYNKKSKEAIELKRIERYQREKSLGTNKFMCDLCNKVFIFKDSLRKHNKTKRHLTALAKLNTWSESDLHSQAIDYSQKKP